MMFRPQLEKTTCATQTSAPNLGIAVKPVNCMHKLDKAAGFSVYSMQLLAQHPLPNQGENGLKLFQKFANRIRRRQPATPFYHGFFILIRRMILTGADICGNVYPMGETCGLSA